MDTNQVTEARPADVLLAPCPFCGAAMFSAKAQVSDGDYGGFLVWCDNCGTEGPTTGTEAEAIAAWNRRAADPVRGELVEALRGLIKELEMSAQRPSMVAQNRARAALTKAGV